MTGVGEADGPSGPAVESRVGLVRGTADVGPVAFARLLGLESLLLDRFARAGYRPVRVPILEGRELHERKSGARIVANLYQVAGEEICLRPEVTAGIVRAFNDAPVPPVLPWRVSYSGPVFRHLPTGPGVLREFHQVGVERLDDPTGDGGGDAESIWLADWALAEAGVGDATVRVGHAGLIRELLRWSGLPIGVQVALVEVLGEASQGPDDRAAGGRVLSAAEAHLEALAAWLGTGRADEPEGDPATLAPDDAGADRLFRTLYPEVVGRRSGRDVIGRIGRKWALGRGLSRVLAKVRGRIRELADLHGPAPEVLDRLGRYEDVVPAMTAELTGLVRSLLDHGLDPSRVELDLGFGRGIGYYSEMMFVLMAGTPAGPLEVCGGGRYDGLARALGSAVEVGGVGFAFGLERLRDALEARGAEAPGAPRRDETLLAASGPPGFALAARLRARGLAVVVEEPGPSGDPRAGSARARGFARLVRPRGDGFRSLDLETGVATDLADADDLIRLLAGARP